MAVLLVLPSIADAPLPPVEVMEPSERVPSSATRIAITEFAVASLLRTYTALAFLDAVLSLKAEAPVLQGGFASWLL